MSFNRHIFVAAFVLVLSVSLFASAHRPAVCDVAISIIDNESGETVDTAEFLVFRKDHKVLRSQAENGKAVFRDLNEGDYGFLAISEGYKNSFFRFDLECGSAGVERRKDVLLPLWKGEGTKTMVLEFAAGAGHLQLKDLGLKDQDGKPSTEAPTKISRGEITGFKGTIFRPEYPEAARAMRIRGSVEVKVTIGFDGKIEKAEAVEGHKLLRDAAEDAAKRSEFEPTFLMGVPIKIEGVLVYKFGVQ